MNSAFVKLNTRPRMTVNKLGEYLAEANASKRRRILASQRTAPRCRVVRYGEARKFVTECLSDPDRDHGLAVLAGRLESLAGWARGPEDSDFDAREKNASRSAVEAFLELGPDLGGRVSVTRGANVVPKLELGGVQVSVRPDLVLRGKSRNGRPFVGAVKFHFSRSSPLNDRSGPVVAALLHEYAEKHLADPTAGEKADPAKCLVIDLAARRVHAAPSHGSRLRAEAEDACREIAAQWDSLPA